MPRIAVAQTPGVRLEQWRETLKLIFDLIRTAAERRADLVVLPECVWPAYHLGSRQALAAARASGMPTEVKLLEELTRAARSHSLAICAGYLSEQADRLLNRACFIDRHGELLGTHDKCFLWDFDRRWFAPGTGIRPIETEFGPVGIMICADARLPEIPATLAARGARLILQPTAWVNAGSPGHLWNPQADFLIAARAAEFGLPVASASKWGREGDTTFVGSSLICDAEGRILSQAPQAETCVLTADVEPGSNPRVRITDSEREALLSAVPPVRPGAAGRATLSLTRAGALLIGHVPQETASPTSYPQADDTAAQRPLAAPGSTLQLRGPVPGVIHSGPAVIGSVR
jgi:predicted amidohydrolase